MAMYPYDFYDPSPIGGEIESFLSIFLVIYLAFFLLAMVFCIVMYILSSLGVYSIAKRRGIRRPWLSWLPVGNMWIIGSISDQYQYVAKGKIKNRRKILLGIMIALLAMSMPIGVVVALAALDYAAAIAGIIFFYLLYVVLAIVGSVFQYIAYYDLFRSCRPDDAVLYLVLGILVPVSMPFFLFSCRKKDLGMPPRKAAPVEPVSLPEPEVVEESIAEAPIDEIPEEE